MRKELTRLKAPQELFDGFAGATEAEKASLRQRAFDWLQKQPKDAKAIYIMPHPETGAEMFLSHPGIQ